MARRQRRPAAAGTARHFAAAYVGSTHLFSFIYRRQCNKYSKMQWALKPVELNRCAVVGCCWALKDVREAAQFALSSIRHHPYPIAMSGTASLSLRHDHNILGLLTGRAPLSTLRPAIWVRVRVQLKAMQRLTGNKTFPVVYDQYTIKQFSCQTPPRKPAAVPIGVPGSAGNQIP